MGMRNISQFDFVKQHSGLVRASAINRLCENIKVYCIKNNIKKWTPELVQKIHKNPNLVNCPDRRVKK